MSFIVYIISYPLLWLLSRLPIRLLYIISDFFYFLIYYVVGYRKEVVKNNLKLVFPLKTDSEITQLSKQFFRHLIDLMIESVKSFSISEKEILKRYKYKNPELINNLAKQGKSIALVGAHKGNWEWIVSLPFALDIDVYGSYTKLANPYFEKKIKKARSRFGFIGIKTTETVKKIHLNSLKKKQGLYILLSDQSPMVHKSHYWKEFFGIKVPIHTGAEMLAKKYDFAVVYYNTTKIKRGYYESEFTLITDTPKEYEKFKLMDEYLSITEKVIKEQPAYYLWSHKRFKHKDKYNQWLNSRKK